MDYILLISDTDDIYSYLKKRKINLLKYSIKKINTSQIKEIKGEEYQAIILDLDQNKLKRSEFKLIFDIKVRVNAPILSVMRGGTTRDRLNAITFGTEDYLDWPERRKEIFYKIDSLCRQKRVLKCI